MINEEKSKQIIDTNSMTNSRYSRDTACLDMGILFPNVDRGIADKDTKHCLKFFINSCFHKFGVQITQIVTALLVIVRRDLYSAFYNIVDTKVGICDDWYGRN